jgi:uridine kinase
MCESHITNQLSDLGQKIAESPTPIKLICVAGPSSSSKTTFANRLRLELMSRGMFPVRISCDDYYKEKKDMKPLPDGSYDFESIEALDIDLFNEQMAALIEGEEVTLSHFNFQKGLREPGRKLRLGPNEPIIVEGIHALNDQMTSSIAQHNKFKIFISPQAQINIDNHTPISLTDFRLLRRIVRDNKFRHSSAEETLSMWPSVRRGEFTWIYETESGADYVFNSLLPYELNIMRSYAMPLLSVIDKSSPYYVTCRRLMTFLKYFTPIDEKDVPDNSLLREFIGGSCFKDV